MTTSLMFCDHANESPQICPCPPSCACRLEGACKPDLPPVQIAGNVTERWLSMVEKVIPKAADVSPKTVELQKASQEAAGQAFEEMKKLLIAATGGNRLRGLPDLSPTRSRFYGVRLDTKPDSKLNAIASATQLWDDGDKRALVLSDDLRFQWAKVDKDGEHSRVHTDDLKSWDAKSFTHRTLQQIAVSIAAALELHVAQCDRDSIEYARTKETADLLYWAAKAANRVAQDKSAPTWAKRKLVEDIATNHEMREALQSAQDTGDPKAVDAVIDQQLSGRV